MQVPVFTRPTRFSYVSCHRISDNDAQLFAAASLSGYVAVGSSSLSRLSVAGQLSETISVLAARQQGQENPGEAIGKGKVIHPCLCHSFWQACSIAYICNLATRDRILGYKR
jgi:hypothetical protein